MYCEEDEIPKAIRSERLPAVKTPNGSEPVQKQMERELAGMVEIDFSDVKLLKWQVHTKTPQLIVWAVPTLHGWAFDAYRKVLRKPEQFSVDFADGSDPAMPQYFVYLLPDQEWLQFANKWGKYTSP